MTELTTHSAGGAERSGSVVVGVLALQGDFAEHAAAVGRVGADVLEVRTVEQLHRVDGLIIPGGESTTIARLMIAYGLREPIIERGREGLPIWGTCAGAILLAEEIVTLDRPGLHLMPMTVERNAYGRQIDSFEADLSSGALGGGPLHAIFIRAPRIRSVAEDVEVLLRLGAEQGHEPVAVQWDSLMATTFHPELTEDNRLHERFVGMCEAYASAKTSRSATKAAGRSAAAAAGGSG
ncbi:MAG: pyridoxal 5'-phosphate synthase glutaminase subunit PdxT [Chloroflexi bacterium]|nr:pyridoxal 5'-phosphate synthase glutaminase subunit PdxT [Chloroflexota bacterium]